jgi:hypothetical protein
MSIIVFSSCKNEDLKLLSFDSRRLRGISYVETVRYWEKKPNVYKIRNQDTTTYIVDYIESTCLQVNGNIKINGDSLKIIYWPASNDLCTELCYKRLTYKILDKINTEFKIALIEIDSIFYKPEIRVSKKEIVYFSEQSYENQLLELRKNTSKDSVLSNDIDFINQVLLNGKFNLDISTYVSMYKSYFCYPVRYSKENIISRNKGFKNLGDLDGDKKDDSVFVLLPLCDCDDNPSYYFTNNQLPRLKSLSKYYHPQNVYNVGDIDEDGVCEILINNSDTKGFYGFEVYSLKNNKWDYVGGSGFMVSHMTKDLNPMLFIRKTGKGKFRMLEIIYNDKKREEEKEWLDFEIK